MSYLVVSHSLAEQAANIADVYESVERVPLARAEILRNARFGKPAVEGIVAAEIAELVDGFILLRYDWWGAPLNPAPSKTLKDALKISWSRRKVRTKFTGEDLRTIAGRSSSIPVYPYDALTLTYYEASELWVLEIDVTVVYPGNTAPQVATIAMTQTDVQEEVAGCDIVSPSVISPVTMVATLDGSIWPLELDGTGAGIPPKTTLVFQFVALGIEDPTDALGNIVSDTRGSISRDTFDVAIDLSEVSVVVSSGSSPY